MRFVQIVALCVSFLFALSQSLQQPESDSATIDRVVRGQIGTLYDLRSKLKVSKGTDFTNSVRYTSKGSRDYWKNDQQNVANTFNPYYSSSFQQRVGKVNSGSTSPSSSSTSSYYTKLSPKQDEGWNNKYSSSSLANNNKIGSGNNKNNFVNSFNVHQREMPLNDYKNKSSSSSSSSNGFILSQKKKHVKISTEKGALSTSTVKLSSPTITTTTTTKLPLLFQSAASSLDINSLSKLTQGFNNAITSALTKRLMDKIDQEIPQGILKPLRHLVSSGNKMVEFWDEKARGRDGKGPGIVEMMGYGLNKLKRYRDGEVLKKSDSVANLTSASKILIQGMVTVKKLTSRVLGYDVTGAESRGYESYGHSGGGMSGYGTGYGGLDPFSLLAALAFGAFLLQLLLTLLNTSARSLDVIDLNGPLMMSDFHIPNSLKGVFGTPMSRSKRSPSSNNNEENELFSSIIDKLDSAYTVYQEVKKYPNCARLRMCEMTVKNTNGYSSGIIPQLYMFALGRLAKEDEDAEGFISSIQKRIENGEDVDCKRIVPNCHSYTKKSKSYKKQH